MEITEDERERLLNPWGDHTGADGWYDGLDPDTESVTCHRCGYEWVYTGGNRTADCPNCKAKTGRNNAPAHEDLRGLSTPMCSAIREAAHDDLTYRAIADLFNFIASASAAQRHATGNCSHGLGGVPPVGERDPSAYPNVTEAECRRLRQRWVAGRFRTTEDAADAFGRHKSTVLNHLKGDCSHERPAEEQRRITARIEANRQESFFTADNPWVGGIADD